MGTEEGGSHPEYVLAWLAVVALVDVAILLAAWFYLSG